MENLLTENPLALSITKHMETIGQYIAAARKEKHKTLRSLARDADVSPTLLSFIEHGKHEPTPELVVRLAGILGADPDHWCALIGKVTPEAQRKMAKIARDNPVFFRNMINLNRN